MTDDLVKRLRIGIHTSEDVCALRDEAADRIEKLEADLETATMKRLLDSDRIEKLEAALREMLSKCTWQKREQWCGSMGCHCQIARKALEGKDETIG